MASSSHCRSHGWLDSLAISMSMLCAVHCLLTPVLVVLLPIVATSFWVHEDFHLWMILFVVPTTSAAVFMGCRKHKDKAVLLLSILGLSLLVAVALLETVAHKGALQGTVIAQAAQSCASCAHCAPDAVSKKEIVGQQGWFASLLVSLRSFAPATALNVVGGLLLVGAHVRNFLLCRKARCEHEH